MKMTRRQFIGLVGAFGAAAMQSGANDGFNWDRFKPWKHLGKQDGPLAFAAINDTHVLDAKSTAIVSRAVNQINATPEIRFTVILGDIATDGHLQEMGLAKAAFDRLQQPCFAVPGNHDVMPRDANPYANYRRAFEKSEWTEGKQGWLFMGIDTCNGTASDVTIPPERLEWIQKQLRKVKAERPIALFTHHPFNPNTKAYRVSNADETLALFASHNLKLVASGHYHGNQIEERDGILFTTTACCASTRNNFDNTDARGYRIFRLDGDNIEHEFVEVPL